MPLETVLFDLENVLVTDRRFTVSRRSFSLNSIFALHLVEQSRSWLPAVSSTALALLVGYTALAIGSISLGIMAGVLLGIAIAIYRSSTPHYSIALDTVDGRFVPLTSGDRFLVEGVASVLQSAIQHSGAHAYRQSSLFAVPSALHTGQQNRRRLFHPGKTA
jgi:hypothetical protein